VTCPLGRPLGAINAATGNLAGRIFHARHAVLATLNTTREGAVDHVKAACDNRLTLFTHKSGQISIKGRMFRNLARTSGNRSVGVLASHGNTPRHGAPRCVVRELRVSCSQLITASSG